jgi:hypothetical protein
MIISLDGTPFLLVPVLLVAYNLAVKVCLPCENNENEG